MQYTNTTNVLMETTKTNIEKSLSSKVDVGIDTNIKLKEVMNNVLREKGKAVSLKSIYEKLIELGSQDAKILNRVIKSL